LSIGRIRSHRKLVFEFFSIVFGCCRSEEFDTQSEDITTVVNILLRTVIQCVAKRSKVKLSSVKICTRPCRGRFIKKLVCLLLDFVFLWETIRHVQWTDFSDCDYLVFYYTFSNDAIRRLIVFH
jgi:hypothetical protein